MPKADVNGIQLYYESHGQGPAIVFAHGRGGNHLSWWRQVPAFAEHYRCITIDHRGWGASIDSTGGPGRTAFVEDLKQLLDHLEIPQAFLVSQSMGGLTCLAFALAYPDRCLGLVLGDTTGGVGDASVLKELEGVQAPASGSGRALCAEFIKNNPDLVFLYSQIQGMNPENANDGIVASFRDENGPNAGELAGLNVPVLLIVGEEDLIFPPNVIRAVHRLIPGSQFEVVPGAAHSTHFEQPKIFNRLVHEFVARVGANKAGAAAD